MNVRADLPVGMAGLHYPITQVSLAVRDLNAVMALYHRAFGWAPWQVFDHVLPLHHNTELRGQKVHYALRGAEVYVGGLNFELLEPLEGPNLWSEFVDRRGEGIASIATMFHDREDGDSVKAEFLQHFGAQVSMKAEIGEHIEYYYLDTEPTFGCLIESGSGHAIDFVKPAQVYPHPGSEWMPSPMSGIRYPITSVSLVTDDLESRQSAFTKAFGWGPWHEVESDTVRVARAESDITFSIVEPGAAASPWRTFLETKGEGLFSIGCSVADETELSVAEAQFAQIDVGVIARGVGPQAGRWLLLDAERDFKCMIELEVAQ